MCFVWAFPVYFHHSIYKFFHSWEYQEQGSATRFALLRISVFFSAEFLTSWERSFLRSRGGILKFVLKWRRSSGGCCRAFQSALWQAGWGLLLRAVIRNAAVGRRSLGKEHKDTIPYSCLDSSAQLSASRMLVMNELCLEFPGRFLNNNYPFINTNVNSIANFRRQTTLHLLGEESSYLICFATPSHHKNTGHTLGKNGSFRAGGVLGKHFFCSKWSW